MPESVKNQPEPVARQAERSLPPAWIAFIRHCQKIGFGEITHLKIQDGLPVMAEETVKKTRFT